MREKEVSPEKDSSQFVSSLSSVTLRSHHCNFVVISCSPLRSLQTSLKQSGSSLLAGAPPPTLSPFTADSASQCKSKGPISLSHSSSQTYFLVSFYSFCHTLTHRNTLYQGVHSHHTYLGSRNRNSNQRTKHPPNKISTPRNTSSMSLDPSAKIQASKTAYKPHLHQKPQPTSI